MKKRLPLITFIIAILFFVIGFFTYQKYIKSKMDNISVQTIEIDCRNNPQKVILSKHPEQSGIFQLEVSIDGKSTKNLNLQIGPNERQIVSDMRIKNGDIESAYVIDWYTDSAYIHIESDKKNTGKLTISYQFIGIDSK